MQDMLNRSDLSFNCPSNAVFLENTSQDIWKNVYKQNIFF